MNPHSRRRQSDNFQDYSEMSIRNLLPFFIACFVSYALNAQYRPQLSFFGGEDAEELFQSSKNDNSLYLKSKLYLLFSDSESGQLDKGDLLALYNIYMYERSSIIEVEMSQLDIDEFVSSLDFGATIAYVYDGGIYFESPVKRIDSRLFNLGLTSVTLPRIKGIHYESSPDINVENLVYIDGFNVIDHKVLLNDEGKMIVAATVGDESFTIPDCVTSIGAGALRGSQCQSIVIPESVKSIGEHTLDSCLELTNVHLKSTIPGDYLTQAVFGCTPLSDITFFVPKSALKAYKKAYPSLKKQFKKAKN